MERARIPLNRMSASLKVFFTGPGSVAAHVSGDHGLGRDAVQPDSGAVVHPHPERDEETGSEIDDDIGRVIGRDSPDNTSW